MRDDGSTTAIDPDTLEEAFDRAMLAGPYICVGTSGGRRVDENRELEVEARR
ncbi:MAG TPA: hypothetical protein VFC31_03945 [Candidatus Limnocylindria bacterium]|nr:hypothetical protein [Candidatus Limnocylindria bacterium]